MTETDKAKLLAGERCPKLGCGSHRISFTDDWWISCKDCGEETDAALLLVTELERHYKKERIGYLRLYKNGAIRIELDSDHSLPYVTVEIANKQSDLEMQKVVGLFCDCSIKELND